MKTPKFTTSVAFGLAMIFLMAQPADGQGFFGWKKKPKPKAIETGSSNLFPGASSPGFVSSSDPSAPRDISIFKSGQPEEVGETNYIIKDGVRVPAPKRRSFFKRNTKANTTTPPVPNTPTANYPDTGPDLTPGNPTSPSGTADRRKVFPRLRKKDEVVSPYESPTVSPAPGTTGNNPPVTFDPSSDAEKESRFSPFAKFRRERETGPAEVLVNEGGTLVPSGTDTVNDVKMTDRVPVTPTGGGSGKPPQKVEGSLVYDSWDDVAARKTSAADQIVSQMKQQEAAHNRKVAAARKDYEQKVRKAEEDARIRAIMQGGVPAR